MKIPKYWARGVYPGSSLSKLNDAYAWGWSFENPEEAQLMALERAKKLAELLNSEAGYGELVLLRQGQEYEYAGFPLREEILETYGDDESGKEIALITRNRYGAVVLNTSGVCFVDVDYSTPTPEPGIWGGLKSIFAGRHKRVAGEEDIALGIEIIQQWASEHPDRGFRLYRTAAGMRLLFTDKLYDPLSDEVKQLFEELGSDLLYRALTRKQESFRARLTPKPWRCGIHEPRHVYPFVTPDPTGLNTSWLGRKSNMKKPTPEELKTQFEKWVVQYDKACEKFGVCELIQSFGEDAIAPVIVRVQKLHDQYTLKDKSLSLA